MEKIIKLKMEKDKSLKIYVNDEEKYSISGDSRSISADKIYEIVGFSSGDHYKVISECEGNTDKQVLDFFKDLFDKIAEKVNALS
jgi:response regulator RpfG family c-di-GMP phosphodiesterase